MLLDELQVHIRVNQESNPDRMAQQASTICSQTYGSSPGHREVKRKNRSDLKAEKTTLSLGHG